MNCAQCAHPNTASAKFCEMCGQRLERTCRQCGEALSAAARFCPSCGQPVSAAGTATPVARTASSYTPSHLAERIRQELQVLESRGRGDGERKTITVLFADLKGSTTLLEGLDPEVARSVIDPALQVMMDAVHRYEGYVAQALGDGILALFGAPLAHEDHAHRAVYAALRMQEDLRRHADTVRLSHGASLAMRVGLNTGEVVVRSIHRDDLHTDYVPVGHSINLAARMEQMAPPGSVLITEHTQRLVEGYFALKSLGQAEIKGVTGALEIFEVTGVSQLRTRLQVAARRGLSPFVGRQHELAQLRAALERARGGHGQVVCVMGEAGLGKSRLLLEFKTFTDGFAVYEAYSASHGKASPYLPIAELLKGFFGIQLQDDERARREKVIGRILALDRGLADVLPYYFALLNIDEPDSPLARMDPPTRRRRTFEALRKVVLRASLDQPLVLIYEDLHWVDSETQGFLDLLVESLGSARILLLTNYRPEYRHDWGGKSYCTQLRLQPFGRTDAEAFVSMLLGEGADAAALAGIRGRILERAEGTPFFIEELVQEFFERGVLVHEADGRVTYRASADVQGQLPTTVQGVLAARIDRLSAHEKALLQTLAVIGREFTLGLAHRVVGGSEDRLYALLAELQRKEFLYEQPAFPEVQYLFKHALTQEVAYQSLLVERRRELHQRIAEVIETLYVRELEDHYASLAHHYGRSGDAEKALEYLERAGLQAARQAAMGEAVMHLSQARALLRDRPDAATRVEQDLRLALALIPAVHMNRGMGTRELEELLLETRVLCERAGREEVLLTVMIELRTNALVRGDCDAALEYSQALLARGEALQDRLYLLHGHTAMAVNRYYSGEFSEALRHIEAVARYYESRVDCQTAAQVGFDPLVMSWFYGAIIGWTQGDFTAESNGGRRAEEIATSVGHPHVIGMVLLGRSVLAGFHGDTVTCAVEAAKLRDLSIEQQFPDWLGCAEAYLGWASAMQGDPDGVRQCRDAIARLGERRFYINHPLLLSLLVECALMHRETGIARDALAEAERITSRGGIHYWDAERARLHGELLATTAGDDPAVLAQAATHFEQALSVAQSQGALSFSLRAALGMARALEALGRHGEARDHVRAVVSRFSATEDSLELSAARAYVEKLEKLGTDPDFRENRGLSPISSSPISPLSRPSTSPTD